MSSLLSVLGVKADLIENGLQGSLLAVKLLQKSLKHHVLKSLSLEWLEE